MVLITPAYPNPKRERGRIARQCRIPVRPRSRFGLGTTLLCLLFAQTTFASEPVQEKADSAAARGYQYLTQKAYLPADFDQETFDSLWKVWPKKLKAQAEQASEDERRELAFSRYGLNGRPEDPTKPLQYVVDAKGNWTMNCFSCHGGKILGETHPGLPNSHYALETLTADVRKTKLLMRKPMSRMDVGSLIVPLGKTNGTTNAVMFGVALMAYRDPELNFYPERSPPKMVHHDMDAPPWWHFKKKKHLYADAFAEKGHRALMQFMMVQENGPEEFKEWESDYEDVYAFLESVEPPKYPFDINHDLASTGKAVFNDNCSHCHGTYGEDASYPNKLIPLEEIGTDTVRHGALSKTDRQAYHKSWFAHFGDHDTRFEPDGYVAPPLDGIWASAPYFHNGSVPTLAQVLDSSTRPKIWKRSENKYDQDRVGLLVEEFDRLPSSLRRADEVRQHFNTSRFGKSEKGHTFPDELSGGEKRAVLEYLKTL